MHTPGFWYREDRTALARLLAPLGSAYGAATLRRMERDGVNAGVPVICIGNPVTGGAGKTPTALALAHLLISAGRRPVFLSRGYGGRFAGPVRVDPQQHGSPDVGDEPLLLARAAPAVVARDRVAGAGLAAGLGDVIVMDDGFQNPALQKTFSLLVVDGGAGVGNGFCLPAGPLRAPLKPQLRRAQGLVLIGEGAPGNRVRRQAVLEGVPIHTARLQPEAASAAALKGRRVLAFAGIGRPEKFAATLGAIGCDVADLVRFGDHHAFSEHDCRALIDRAEREQLLLVTTEKDHVRLSGGAAQDELARRTHVLAVTLVFDSEESLASDLMVALAAD